MKHYYEVFLTSNEDWMCSSVMATLGAASYMDKLLDL